MIGKPVSILLELKPCPTALGNPLFHSTRMVSIYYQGDCNGRVAQEVVTHEFSQ